ncbi:MAG: AgmX/PglI C-terminal domain-containing protein [candidate division KSB1 bacterium]|nr:AgmX/PglI C-terminal domain-containing protein [candidate division KSB1 bacterium]MDZ7333563.1 AgmX/PglI C-terminal domain-containing protein [candidate division KSB1 bacterium]MDZ7357008.1 AgmX/PglI C-terminal domain-containing protein [candidate division KSB1 bacterium]MDZ7376770.1 AgmX/PglI C-terminal domain-containing protein [candidate division KSB1 bacterium]MDZ7398677.1 AgmX/PglI C-terminal domain-containing protein [candidate division KSB1 bacterium]
MIANLRFPKEFKRSWLSRYDPRFVAILLGTFVFQASLLWFLVSWVERHPQGLDSRTIQQRYAHLLLEQSGESDFFAKFSKKQETYFYAFSERNDRSFAEIATSAEIMRSGGKQAGFREGSNRGISSVPGGRTLRASEAWGNGAFSGSGSNEPSPGVAAMGILAYLTNDPQGTGKEIRDVLSYQAAGNGSVDGTLLASGYGIYGRGGELAAGSGASAGKTSGFKGIKTVVPEEDIEASLTPLDRASLKTIAKNTELEASQEALLAQKAHKAVARKPDQVTRVVMEHNRAIQDCYKQALKHQPDLKGKVVVRFFVAPDGKVTNVELISSTVDYEPMIHCILNRIRHWNDFGECDISLGTVGYRQTYVFGY